MAKLVISPKEWDEIVEKHPHADWCESEYGFDCDCGADKERNKALDKFVVEEE